MSWDSVWIRSHGSGYWKRLVDIRAMTDPALFPFSWESCFPSPTPTVWLQRGSPSWRSHPTLDLSQRWAHISLSHHLPGHTDWFEVSQVSEGEPVQVHPWNVSGQSLGENLSTPSSWITFMLLCYHHQHVTNTTTYLQNVPSSQTENQYPFNTISLLLPPHTPPVTTLKKLLY